MIKEYINSKPVVVCDHKKGLKKKKYRDNIEEVLLAKNEIGFFKKAIKGKSNKLDKLDKKKEKYEGIVLLIYILNSLTFTIIACSILFKYFWWLPSVIAFSSGFACDFSAIYVVSSILNYFPKKKIKKIKSQIAVLEGEIPLLEMELELRKSQYEELKKDKTKELKPTNEIVSLTAENERRKQLLDEKIALIELACKNKEEAKKEAKKDGRTLALIKFKKRLKLDSKE